MGESTEFVEHMEHAAHSEHGHDHHPSGVARRIGVTMAILGALLAACSALVGSVRTELIATMVEQTQVSMRNQSVATRYRMLQAQLSQLHAVMPDVAEFTKTSAALDELEKQPMSADSKVLLKAMRLEAARILNTVTPSRDDLHHFARRIRMMEKVKEASKVWSESYTQAITILSEAAARYEWAQLSVELAIVLASVSLLFMSRPMWLLSLLLGLTSLGIVTATAVTLHSALHHEVHRIEEVRAEYEGTIKEMAKTQGRDEREEDEKMVKDIEAR